MKVLHLYKTYSPVSFGGVESFIKELCTGLYKKGVSNDLLICAKKPLRPYSCDPKAENIFWVGGLFSLASCPVSMSYISKFKRLVNECDVVHLNFPYPMADLAVLFHLPKDKPLVITYHSDIYRQKILKYFYTPLMSRTLSRANAIVCTSKNYMKSSRVLQRYESKVKCIPLAIDDFSFQLMRSKSVPINFPEAGFILFIGQYRHYKGIEYLIEAFKSLDHQLVLVGVSESDIKCGISVPPNVLFLGKTSDHEKNTLLRNCRALVLPSINRAEAFGIVLLEALSFGKPLITTDLQTGTSFVNRDGYTGVVVPPKDPVALAKAVEKIYDDDLYDYYSGNCKAWCEENFSLSTMIESYFSLYNNLMV